jgi:TrkA domain protein
MLRGLQLPRQSMRDVQAILAATLTETYRIEPGSPAIDCSIRELDLRSRAGVSIIALVRDGEPHVNPDPDLRIALGDVVVLLGSHAALEDAMARLAPGDAGRDGGTAA